MLFLLFDEPFLMLVSHGIFIGLLIVGIKTANVNKLGKINSAMLHGLYPTIGFIFGGFVDLSIYASSIGGIQGATPYTFLLFFHFPLMYGIAVGVLALFLKPTNDKR